MTEQLTNQRFPDTRYGALDKETMLHALCRMWGMPAGKESFEKISLPIPNKVGITEADLVHKPGPPNWRVLELVKNLSQEDRLWLKARAQPKLLTASILAEALGMRDPLVAKRMDIPPYMVTDGGAKKESRFWDCFRMRVKHPEFPGDPLDRLSGEFFTTHGKNHENNAHYTFCVKNPHLRGHEQGLTYLTPGILDRIKLKNALTGKVFDEKTLLSKLMFAASPDAIFVNPETGETFNGEWKAATSFVPLSEGSGLAGVSFFSVPKAGPYKKLKSYYIPQVQLQLLCCENKTSFFGCWTASNGMRVWKMMLNKRYLELMFTIFVYIYDEYISKNKNVPTDLCADLRNPALAPIYAEFITLNSDILVENATHIVEKYAFYGDTMAINNNVLGIPPDGKPVWRGPEFPSMPPELPAYASLGLLLRHLTNSTDHAWTDNPYDIRVRYANLSKILRINELAILRPIVETNILIGCQPFGLDTKRELSTHLTVQMHRLNRAELLVSHAALELYNLRTGRRTYAELARALGVEDYKKLDFTVPIAHIKALAQKAKFDMAFGIHPPTRMLVPLYDSTAFVDGETVVRFLSLTKYYYEKVIAKQAQHPEINTMVEEADDLPNLLDYSNPNEKRAFDADVYIVSDDEDDEDEDDGTKTRRHRKRQKVSPTDDVAKRGRVGLVSPAMVTNTIVYPDTDDEEEDDDEGEDNETNWTVTYTQTKGGISATVEHYKTEEVARTIARRAMGKVIATKMLNDELPAANDKPMRRERESVFMTIASAALPTDRSSLRESEEFIDTVIACFDGMEYGHALDVFNSHQTGDNRYIVEIGSKK